MKVQLEVKIIPTKEICNLYTQVITASVKSYLSNKLIADMHRTTKKNPPVYTELKMMLTNFDEYAVSAITQESVLSSLVPGSTEQGHIYIGFPTHQTTGCAMQVYETKLCSLVILYPQ
jgi:Protein of unknown function (DUF3684)